MDLIGDMCIIKLTQLGDLNKNVNTCVDDMLFIVKGPVILY